MNRALVLITISILFLSYAHYLPGASTASGAPAIEWSKTYAQATSYVFEGLPYLVRQTADGGYAIAGSTDKVQPGIWHFWLIRTDSNGIVQWNKTYGGPERDRLWSFVQTSDGGFALIGDEPDVGLALLVKVDLNGNVEWNKTLGTTNGDTIHSITETVDGGYAMAGITNGAGYDGILMKTDSAGNMQWYKTYGGASNDQFESVVQSSDGGYAMAGATQSFDSSGKTKAYFVKTDSGGNMQWNKTYSRTAGHDYGRAMIQTGDGGYAIAGQTDYFGSGDAWLIKIDSAGNLTWDTTYNGRDSDFVVSIVQTKDGGYTLGGQTDYWQNGDAWLIKTDPSGNALWNETFGGLGYDRGCSAIQTVDGGYALSGFTNSFSGDGSYEVWLIKLAGSGSRTWIVDDDGPADFNTIQDAINAAIDGDTVFVKAGTYSEPIQINKALILLGENKSKTFIKDWYIGVYANNVRISNFTIEKLWADSPSGAGGCVYIYGFDNLTFSDNIVLGDYQGIRLIQTSGDVIINNFIDGTSQGGTHGGIGFDYVNNTIMRNNTITNCSNALSLSLPNYNNTILENNIIGNSFGIVMNNLLTGNRFYHNNVINNNEQVYTYHVFQGVNDAWDNGYPSGGNYWSDYSGADLFSGPYQNISGSDGIGDMSYIIDQQNLDYYPLMYEFPPPSIAIAPIADFTYSPTVPLEDEAVTFDASISKNGWNGTQSVPISTYEWDFGDNSVSTEQVATHTYVMPGNFTVMLNVTDAQGLWNVTQKQIQIGQPHSPSAAFTINPKFTYVDQELMLNASATLPGWNGTHENPIIFLTWDFGDGNVTSSHDSTIIHSYAYAGNFDVTLTVSDSENMSSSCSQTILVVMPTSMSISTSATSSVIGYFVSINGTLSDIYGNPIGNEPVVLYYTFPGITSVFPMTSSITDDNGQYSAQWIPTATGTYCLIAEWTGNMTYSGARNNVTMSCLYAMTQYIFSVESNSSISALAFNTTSLELAFTASGPSGTSGYVKITVAKSLIANITNVRVYLDNILTEFSVASTDNSWVLSFSYFHSTHKLRIDLVSSRIADIAGPAGQPDRKCDMRDVALVARNFGRTVPPAPVSCDLTGPSAGLPDGIIDMRDIDLIVLHYGERYQ